MKIGPLFKRKHADMYHALSEYGVVRCILFSDDGTDG
jgi:hypothetical protein